MNGIERIELIKIGLDILNGYQYIANKLELYKKADKDDRFYTTHYAVLANLITDEEFATLVNAALIGITEMIGEKIVDLIEEVKNL